jgi:hypothetical protein
MFDRTKRERVTKAPTTDKGYPSRPANLVSLNGTRHAVDGPRYTGKDGGFSSGYNSEDRGGKLMTLSQNRTEMIILAPNRIL